jgi:hypothetical protein
MTAPTIGHEAIVDELDDPVSWYTHDGSQVSVGCDGDLGVAIVIDEARLNLDEAQAAHLIRRLLDRVAVGLDLRIANQWVQRADERLNHGGEST